MGIIRIIGPRGAGKTTLLAALACVPVLGYGRRLKNYKIQAQNEDAHLLIDKAEDILKQGESLEPTVIQGGLLAQPLYMLELQVKSWFRAVEQIQLEVRDYPGEIFEALSDATSLNPIHHEFWSECVASDVDGCLVLLADWQAIDDQGTKRILRQFTRLLEAHDRLSNLRLAVAISKCERGELWSGRLDPKLDLFTQHLPGTLSMLQSRIPPKNLRLYAVSAFGVLSRTDPRPNRVDVVGSDGRNSVLRQPKRWQPYGLIDPLYWLSTGKSLNYFN
jgi:energy-coupling factor transporter ATP-binding protein EcfA2